VARPWAKPLMMLDAGYSTGPAALIIARTINVSAVRV
jgi:hypothetical protein